MKTKTPDSSTKEGFLPEELIKKVKHIEIASRKVVDDMMAGQYKSHFKGHGVQFSEHRLYTPGDDIRHIDWKVSARSRDPYIKKFDEERELTVMLVVDISGSEGFGTARQLKSEAAAEIAGMIAYAAINTGDKVGVVLFSDQVESIIPPKKGKLHVLRVIREILGHEPTSTGTNIAVALDATSRIMKHSGVVFVISDFLDKNYDIPLKRLSRKNDVVAVWLEDRRESEIPTGGYYLFVDPETGEESVVNTSSYGFKNWMLTRSKHFEEQTLENFRAGKVEHLRILTKDDHADAVVRFFRTRKYRRK